MATPPGGTSISLSELRVGVVLPADVTDERNASVLLLRKGTPITQAFLIKLQNRGVKRVMVDKESAAILRGEAPPAKTPAPRAAAQPGKAQPVERPIDRLQKPKAQLPSSAATKQTVDAKQEHLRSLGEVFASAQRNSTANGHLARQVVEQAVEHMMADIDVFLKVALQTSESSETYEHCLAAAQLAMSVGLVEGLSQQAIHDLGAGCMLSRIGQSEAASRYAEQMRTLSNIELIDLKRTPCHTFDYLQHMSEITVGARNVAYQIFERFNGTGYPRGRAGNQITPLARIASVCDVYVALTSPRPHRPAFEPYQAVEILLQETREGKFDPTAVRGLLKTIGLFPIGSYVRLNDGTLGQVVRIHNDAYDRPVVHLIFDDVGNSVQQQGTTIDLQSRPELGIDAAVSTEVVQGMLYSSTFSEPLLTEARPDPQLCLAFDE